MIYLLKRVRKQMRAGRWEERCERLPPGHTVAIVLIISQYPIVRNSQETLVYSQGPIPHWEVIDRS